MKANGYALSDPGLKRSANEDSFLMDEELGLFVVCDGVGGHVAGGVASEMAGKMIRHVVNDGRLIIQKYNTDRSLKNRAVVAGGKIVDAIPVRLVFSAVTTFPLASVTVATTRVAVALCPY